MISHADPTHSGRTDVTKFVHFVQTVGVRDFSRDEIRQVYRDIAFLDPLADKEGVLNDRIIGWLAEATPENPTPGVYDKRSGAKTPEHARYSPTPPKHLQANTSNSKTPPSSTKKPPQLQSSLAPFSNPTLTTQGNSPYRTKRGEIYSDDITHPIR